MSPLNKKHSKLLNIINDNNLCISNNPKGIDINWPKSFAKLYYSKYLEEIYIREQSPKILEINQPNQQKIELWKYFFNNPVILKENIYNWKDYKDSNNLNSEDNFDIIVLQNYKLIDNIYKIISLLKKKLNSKGILLIENVYFSNFLVFKLFFLQETRIFDYRYDKFCVDNCLIEIRNNGIFSNTLSTFIDFYRLIIHLLIEILYTFLYKIKKFFRK